MKAATLMARFATLNPRERRLVTAAAALIMATLLWQLAEWAFTERNRLDRRLPAAEATLSRMQLEAEELAQLRRLAPPAESTLAVRAQTAQAAAAARQLDLTVDADARGLRISGSADAAALLDWLASMQSQQQLQVEALSLEPVGSKLKVEGLLTPSGLR